MPVSSFILISITWSIASLSIYYCYVGTKFCDWIFNCSIKYVQNESKWGLNLSWRPAISDLAFSLRKFPLTSLLYSFMWRKNLRESSLQSYNSSRVKIKYSVTITLSIEWTLCWSKYCSRRSSAELVWSGSLSEKSISETQIPGLSRSPFTQEIPNPNISSPFEISASSFWYNYWR